MTTNKASSSNPTLEPKLTPEQEAALALLQGGSLDDFYQSLSDAAMARTLIAFLRANHDQLERPEGS
jgi:hypothetical protein